MSSTAFRVRSTPRNMQLKRAVSSVFAGNGAQAAHDLVRFKESDWQSILRWLDISGMALYLLDQLRGSGMENLLPPVVLLELEWRLERNRERTRAMFKETREICEGFDRAGIPYALLKGIALTPDSVPDAALRWQGDLDFMVPRRCERAAREYVEGLGYRLHVEVRNTFEFRAGTPEFVEMRNAYSVLSERALEVHIDDGQTDTLACRRVRRFHGARISTLRPADIFVGQALHLLKHLCGEHTRLSWVLEFRRHAQSRRHDHSFWEEVRALVAQQCDGDLAMGMAFWLAEYAFGLTDVAVPAVWTEDALPPRVLLWLRRFAHSVLFADNPGTKFFALLRREVPGQAADVVSTLGILLPPHVPLPITQRPPQESRIGRLRRRAIETQHFLRRLKFHAVEGLRFAIEVVLWKRALARSGRSGVDALLSTAPPR